MSDIVERLRKHVNNRGGPAMVNGAWQMMLNAADEIERLRVALENLTEDPPATLDEPDPDWEVIIKIRNIAREALGLPHGPTQ